MSPLKEFIQNIPHCLDVSVFYCNFFLVSAQCLHTVTSLPRNHGPYLRHQTTELANECSFPATQNSPKNMRFVLPCSNPFSVFCCHALGVAFSSSPKKIPQAVSLHQENRGDGEAKTMTLKFRCQVQ